MREWLFWRDRVTDGSWVSLSCRDSGRLDPDLRGVHARTQGHTAVPLPPALSFTAEAGIPRAEG